MASSSRRRVMPPAAEIIDAVLEDRRFCYGMKTRAVPVEDARITVQARFKTTPAFARDWLLKACLDDDRVTWLWRIARYGWAQEAYLDDDGSRQWRHLGGEAENSGRVTVYLDWNGHPQRERPADTRDCHYVALRSTVDGWVSAEKTKRDAAKAARQEKETEAARKFHNRHGSSVAVLNGLLHTAGATSDSKLRTTYYDLGNGKDYASVELTLTGDDITAVAEVLRGKRIDPV